MLDDTCDQLKQDVEEEMLATSMDEGISVEPPHLQLSIPILDQTVINGKVVTVVIPAKRPPVSCDADEVIDEQADLQKADADHEYWNVALFLNPAFFFANLVSTFFS